MEQQIEGHFTQVVESKSLQSVIDSYNDWSNRYDADLSLTLAAQSRLQFARIAAKHAANLHCRMLDVGSGTGLSGEALRQVGFTNIDGIDGSSGMLERARGKGVYRKLFLEMIGRDRVVSCQPGAYDLLFACGAFIPNHLDSGHLPALLDLLRPGGIFVINLRERWRSMEFGPQLEADMARLETEGRWQRIAWEEYHSQSASENAIVYVYRKL